MAGPGRGPDLQNVKIEANAMWETWLGTCDYSSYMTWIYDDL